MRVLSRKNVTTINYSIMTRKGLSVKYKLKLVTKDVFQDNQYFYQEFILTNGDICVNVAPRYYLDFTLISGEENGCKVSLYVTDVACKRLVNKLKKVAGAFEMYDCGEVDFLVVDQTGTHLIRDIATPITVHLGIQSITFQPILNEAEGKVMMTITSGNVTSCLYVAEFISLYHRLHDLNMPMLAAQLMTYLNVMPFGEERRDFRRSVASEDNIPETTRSYNKISVMGSLIDIENPEGLIAPQVKNNPSW